MAQFKRFNTSENDNYNSSSVFPEGTLTWDPSNGLRIHDGNTSGGNAVSASTGYTRFLGTGIGSYDTNNSTSYNMTISPNWDGEFTGNAYINIPSNENFGSSLQIVQNSTGGVQIITQNDAAWSFEPNGNLILPVNGDIKDRDGNSVLGSGSGTTLPLDASGVLKNDGTGTLSWSTLDVQDLTDNGNLLNFTQTQADWTENNAASPAYIQNKPMLVTSYNDLADKPNLFNGDYLSLSGTPSLANVATTGEYGDLINTPTNLSQFNNDSGFITSIGVDASGSGSLSYSNGVLYYTGPTVPTDISSLTDNTNIIPTDVSDLTDNNSLLPAAQVRYIMKSASFTAEIGKVYWLDSTGGAYTVTLPASPTTGDWVTVYDAEMKWTTNNVTVDGNGNNVRIMNMGGGGFAWSSPASTVTMNQAVYSPVGPMPNKFVWNGTVWSGSM